LRWPLMFVLIILGLSVLYRYGPSRRLAKWRWISLGSVFAALAWLAVSSLFSWYLGNFANYNATYGALGAVVGLMMWMWVSTIVVLVGAELNSDIEHQTAHDSTVGPAKPLGAAAPSWPTRSARACRKFKLPPDRRDALVTEL
jgi:membrane protein